MQIEHRERGAEHADYSPRGVIGVETRSAVGDVSVILVV
jgi:hypothetical protein